MTRFDRYMLSQLMVLFGFFSLILVMVYWVNRAISLFDELIADGQSAWVFLEFTALTLPNVIRVVLPISAFIAAVYVTNRLSNESELVVMQSSGYSSFRLARPVVSFGLIVAVLLMILTNILVPASNRALADRQDEIARNITARFLKDGQFLHPAAGVTFYIREITPAGELRDIFLSDQRNPDRSTIYTARSALLVNGDDGPKLLMFRGQAQSKDTETALLSVTKFQELNFDLSGLMSGSKNRRIGAREMPTLQLLTQAETLAKAHGWDAKDILIEAHDRLAQPILAIVTALIGFSCLLLGGFSRFGVWRQIIVAVVLLTLIKTFDNQMADLARGGPGLWPLLYLPAILGMALGAVILWVADIPTLFSRRKEAAA